MRLLITSLFLLLTAWFALGSGSGTIPMVDRIEVSPADIDRDPRRAIQSDPPKSIIGGMAMSCDACHGIFESGFELGEANTKPRLQHLEIELKHGLNTRCFNCHSRENRNRLILPGENEIGFDEVQRLCASCHGPTYRDWAKGIHGKSRGSWEIGSPDRHLLLCTECHDPHKPAFEPIRPLPPPQTLHKGKPASDHEEDVHQRNPLRRRHPSPKPTHKAD